MRVTARLIKADIVTRNGNFWSRKILEEAVQDINVRIRSGSSNVYFMNRDDLTPIGKPAAVLLTAEITNDGEVLAHLESCSSREAKVFEQLVRTNKIKYLPVIELGLGQPVRIGGKNIIESIRGFKKVGINLDAETKGKLGI